jgi:glycosyltransferase involved in cell wall biosynthesis
MMRQVDLHGVVPDLIRLFEEFRPDVVEIHHLLLIGAEFPALVRRVLPSARIVLMLHDYYQICAHDGLMIRRHDRARCLNPSPDECHRCFPETPAARFFLREITLKTHLSAVDAFISPSQFLKERYVEWGLDAGRIDLVPNGHPPGTAAPKRGDENSPRNAFGYFGNLNPWKGVSVLLEACRLLAEEKRDFTVNIHGAPLFQTDAFVSEIDAGFARAGPHVRRFGNYRRDEIPDLMADVDWVIVPSIWWENAPLTIGEAQFHGRPVIASGIGGMAELVRDGVNGMHVRAGDPADLARVMRSCIEERGLWQRLSGAAEPPAPIDDIARRHIEIFDAARPSMRAQAAA